MAIIMDHRNYDDTYRQARDNWRLKVGNTSYKLEDVALALQGFIYWTTRLCIGSPVVYYEVSFASKLL